MIKLEPSPPDDEHPTWEPVPAILMHDAPLCSGEDCRECGCNRECSLVILKTLLFLSKATCAFIGFNGPAEGG